MPGFLSLSLSLMKAQSHKYRQYQFPLRKVIPSTLFYRNHPELYILYTITVCTQQPVITERQRLKNRSWHCGILDIDLHNTICNGINLRGKRPNQDGRYGQ